MRVFTTAAVLNTYQRALVLDLGARPQSAIERARVARGRTTATREWTSLPYARGQSSAFSVAHVKNERSAADEYDVYQILGASAPLAPEFMALVARERLVLTPADEGAYRLRVPHSFYLRRYVLPFDVDAPLALDVARYVLGALACFGAVLYMRYSV